MIKRLNLLIYDFMYVQVGISTVKYTPLELSHEFNTKFTFLRIKKFNISKRIFVSPHSLLTYFICI